MVYFFVLWSFLLVLFSFVCQFLLKGRGIAAEPVSDNAPQTNKHDVVDRPQEEKYDVFVSFRGEDIRDGFLSHLAEAFRRKKINAFVDEKLKRGQEIWPSLVGAIEGSLVSVIIFSENYATSPWCLNELVEILECRDKYVHTVIPVFYCVDPTDVRYQTGSYKAAFAEHRKLFDPTLVQIWRDVLNKSANLSGTKSSDFLNEAELLEKIINDVLHQLRRLSKLTLNSKGLVGIDKPIADIEVLLRNMSKEVRIIGIWGMGGIGKTTIAEQVFNKTFSEYEGSCFLSNLREESRRHGIIYLKERLFSILLEEDVKIKSPSGLSEDIRRRIGRMKVLIVLDDVNVSDHLELFGTIDNFGPGSRIIVTTRDKQLLIAKDIDDIYKVEVLSSSDALNLFNLIALNQGHLETQYHETSMRVVDYAQGIPLVLKVLGHLLHGKGDEVWESQLNKLKQMPSQEVYDVMRLSYDDLDRKEQKIFLDLACFVIRLNLKVDIIKTLLKDSESDSSVAHGLERLKDLTLIIISEDNVVSMHDIVQEIAWEIVHKESREDIGSQSRLGYADDINKVLENDKGNEVVRSIWMHLSSMKKLKLSSQIFTKMSKLQFLDFHCDNDILEGGFLLPKELSLPTELRYLRWMYYPLESLPEEFCAEKLVILDLSHSKVIRLWHGVQNLVNLKQVNLDWCKSLKKLPDFSKAINLEVLHAGKCSCLTDVHSSVFYLDKLVILDLRFCNSLTSLSLSSIECYSRGLKLYFDLEKAAFLEGINAFKSRGRINLFCPILNLQKAAHLSRPSQNGLSHLSLEGCENLTYISMTSENMIELNLKGTSINALPSSFGSQRKLEILVLESTQIKSLPPCMVNLTRLQYLNLRDCEKLQTLPELPPSIETLLIQCCSSLKTVVFPSTTEQVHENKKRVEFFHCKRLDERSLMANGLNARINVMKFAHQHLFKLQDDSVENYDNYIHNYHSYQAVHLFPGSTIPEWLVYKTTGDFVIIDLSSRPPSPQFGFIFCFIISECPSYGQYMKFKVMISDGGVEEEKDSVEVYVSSYTVKNTDHVCVIYDQRCSHYLSRRSQNLSRFEIKVSTWFLEHGHEPKAISKGFGVSLIRTSEYHSFIKQMK